MIAICSMTGYATGQLMIGPDTLTVTVKSVNHRILDLVLRVPRGLDHVEGGLRSLVKQHVHRGHVEFSVTLDHAAAPTTFSLDHGQLTAYLAIWRQAGALAGLDVPPQIHELLRLPGVLATQTAKELQPETAKAAVTTLAEQVLRQHNIVRAEEGRALAVELKAVASRLKTLTLDAAVLHKQRPDLQRQRLAQRLTSILGGHSVDQNRLFLEAALLAERADIDEELVRLQTHIHKMRELLEHGGEIGRPLDFLLQELNREANTLLSKSGNHGPEGLDLTDLGLQLKLEIERAREQVQNLE